MNARMITVQFQAGKTAEGIEIVRKNVVPDLGGIEGLKHFLVLSDPETDKALTISIYDTQAHMMAPEESGWLKEKVGACMPLMAAPPVTEYYQVDIDE